MGVINVKDKILNIEVENSSERHIGYLKNNQCKKYHKFEFVMIKENVINTVSEVSQVD